MWAQGKPRGRGDRRLCKPGGSQGVETARSLSGHPRAASWPGGAHQSLRLTGPSTVAWGTRMLLSGVRGAVCTRLCRGGSSAKPCRVHVLARATWSPSAGPSALAVRHWLLPRPCPRPRGASQAEQLWLQPLRPGTFIHVNIARNPGHVTGARTGQRGRTFARRPPPGGRGRRREGACGKASLRARRPAG